MTTRPIRLSSFGHYTGNSFPNTKVHTVADALAYLNDMEGLVITDEYDVSKELESAGFHVDEETEELYRSVEGYDDYAGAEYSDEPEDL